jgi:glyoxylase-like metal-dependent hydrolase (beta-lactamase superfamily II)
MEFLDRLDNVYVIDTKMRGFDHYQSSYLVKGKELALIDTGEPQRFDPVRAAINAHGFSVSDISYVFITHCEHRDHSGNAAAIVKESPRANVYINPIGLDYLINPAIESARKQVSSYYTPKMLARRKEMEAVPESRVKILKDGDTFDLGNDEKLKIFFTPGHQPSGIAIYKGLFINDLVGNCFIDADSQYPLNSFRSDHQKAIASIKQLMNLSISNLYMGHYGICDKPYQVMGKAIDNMQKQLEIGRKLILKGHPELIPDEVLKGVLPELEKLRSIRGEEVYQYAVSEHVNRQATLFAEYCKEKLEKATIN